MVRRAVWPGGAAVLVAFATGSLVAGPGTGGSAALGVAVVFANFAASALALAWARGVSLTAFQTVAYAGFIVRLGVVLALLFGLRVLGWFSPSAFGLAALGGAVLLLAYESKLVLGGLGAELEIPREGSAPETPAESNA